MLRRGVLKALFGGAVAAPALAKQAVAATLGDLDLGPLGLAVPEAQSPAPIISMSVAEATDQLARLNLRGALAHEFFRRRQPVWHLDPDLASYRSFSLAAKLQIQQGRNYDRDQDQQRAWLLARIAGLVE